MNAKQLKRLLDSSGVTQTGAARELGINDRTMRRYVSGELDIPRMVEIAVRQLVKKGGKRVVGIDELTEGELESFGEALGIARGVAASGFIHTEPVKDANGRLCEVRVYSGDHPPELAAVVPIGADGHAQPAEVVS